MGGDGRGSGPACGGRATRESGGAEAKAGVDIGSGARQLASNQRTASTATLSGFINCEHSADLSALSSLPRHPAGALGRMVGVTNPGSHKSVASATSLQ